MQQSQKLFDKSLYRRRKQNQTMQIDFLHRLIEERMCERLDNIKRNFANVLIYGGAKLGTEGGGIATHAKIGKAWRADMVDRSHVDLVYDDEALPFADCSFDAIFSILHLHHANDLAGALIQMRQALKPDGLLLAAVAGVHSLRELRECLATAEIQAGGVSPRVAPFMDIRDAGALLQRAGLQLPVVDDEIIDLSYNNMFSLMQELRAAGEGNILHDRCRKRTSRSMFMNAALEYEQRFSDEEGRVKATAHVLYLTGWRADSSQQQPLQRGSATINMKEMF